MRCRNAGCNEPSVDDGNSDFSLLSLKVLPLTVSLGFVLCYFRSHTYIKTTESSLHLGSYFSYIKCSIVGASEQHDTHTDPHDSSLMK